MTDHELEDQQTDNPFTGAVEELKQAIDDPEHFDLAVKAALARVKSYTRDDIAKGRELPPSHAELAYEHGFTLFRRELSDDLTLPFARTTAVEVERKDENQQPVYEQPFLQAFRASFENELSELEEDKNFEKAIGRLIVEKPSEVERPQGVAPSTTAEVRQTIESSEELPSEARSLYEKMFRQVEDLRNQLERKKQQVEDSISRSSESAKEGVERGGERDIEVLNKALASIKEGNIKNARAWAERGSDSSVRWQIREALDKDILDYALASVEEGNIRNARAWAEMGSDSSVRWQIREALDNKVFEFAQVAAKQGDVKNARAWANLGSDSSVRWQIKESLDPSILMFAVAAANKGDVKNARAWADLGSDASVRWQIKEIVDSILATS